MALALLVLHLLELFLVSHRLILCLLSLLFGQLFLVLFVLLNASGGPGSPLSGLLSSLLSASLFDGSQFFSPSALDSCKALLPLSLKLELGLLLSFEGINLLLPLFSLLLLLLLLENSFELLNRASVLVSQLLQLGSLLFLFLLLTSFLVFLVLAHKLSHQLVRLL